MLQKLRNKRGDVFLAGIIALAILGGLATYETASNGVLKNNGKKIWCKMQNKGNDYCDNLYQ